MKMLNRDYARREEILQDYYSFSSMGGMQRFANMDVFTLQKLVDEGFVDLEDAQNSAPCVGDILKFMKAYPGFTCHGYAVDPKREDYRISLEGVEYNDMARMEQVVAFAELFRFADDFVIQENRLYCWFD